MNRPHEDGNYTVDEQHPPDVAVEALEHIDALCIDAENKWGDPHTLRHAKEAVTLLRAAIASLSSSNAQGRRTE